MKIVADLKEMRKNLEERRKILYDEDAWTEELEEYKLEGQQECEIMERIIEEYERVERRNLQMISHVE